MGITGGGPIGTRNVEPQGSIFEQPNVHGDVAPAPDAPLPAVPTAPAGFEAPSWPGEPQAAEGAAHTS